MLTPILSSRGISDLELPGPSRNVPVAITAPKSKWGFPECFAIAQVAGPALLYIPGSQAFRTPLRSGVFALSLIGLVWCFRSPKSRAIHPSWIMLLMGAIYMAIMIFHPATNTKTAGMAQIGMHLAVAAPLFWAPRFFRGDCRRLLRVVTILWLLNGASAVVGILQARDPARWMPKEFTSVMAMYNQKITMYQYKTDEGSAIRPPGLGDSPGSACAAGMFVTIVGIAYLGLPVSRLRKFIGLILGVAGVLVIFLSHVRSSLIVAVGCGVVYSIVMIVQRRLLTVLSLALWMTACGMGGFFYAELYGGKSTVNRFATLFAEDPIKVYAKSARLGMVIGAFDTYLVDHPLGAGLGRWGMMRKYFGNEGNYDSPELWAEVQFAAWVLDGGGVLLTLYMLALAVAIRRLLRHSFSHEYSTELRAWGAVVIMLSAGPVACLFSYCPFYSQMGMQFWLLIGAYEGLVQSEWEQAGPGDVGEAPGFPGSGYVDEYRLLFDHG